MLWVKFCFFTSIPSFWEKQIEEVKNKRLITLKSISKMRSIRSTFLCEGQKNMLGKRRKTKIDGPKLKISLLRVSSLEEKVKCQRRILSNLLLFLFKKNSFNLIVDAFFYSEKYIIIY